MFVISRMSYSVAKATNILLAQASRMHNCLGTIANGMSYLSSVVLSPGRSLIPIMFKVSAILLNRRVLIAGAGVTLSTYSAVTLAYLLRPGFNASRVIFPWGARSFDHALFDLFKSRIATWREVTIPESTHSANPHHVHNVVRDRAKTLITSTLAQTDYPPYYVQCEGQQAGSSMLIDPVDYGSRTQVSTEQRTLVFIDVDYYLDMTLYMWGDPIVVYGFVPFGATNESNDSTHYYFRNDHVHFKCNAGYETTHKLWDYGADYVSAIHRGTWLFAFYNLYNKYTGCSARYSFNTVSTTYRVTRLDLAHDRVLLFMVPWFEYIKNIVNLPMRRYVPRATLRRHRFNYANWTAFKYWTTGGMMVSLAYAGDCSRGITMPLHLLQRACDLQRYSDTKMSNHNIQVATSLNDAWLISRFIADLVRPDFILDLVQRGWRPIETPPVPPAPAVQECSCDLHQEFVHDGTAIHVAYTRNNKLRVLDKEAPKVTVVQPTPETTSRAPLGNQEDVLDAIRSRVIEPQKLARQRVEYVFDNVKPLLEYFVVLFRLVNLEPASDVDVLQRVPAKSRARVQEGLTTVGSRKDCRVVSCFVKAELYPTIKPPRLITPLHESVQARGYKFVYPLQDALHDAAWFAFGHPPVALAQRLAEVSDRAARNGWVCFSTDYHYFDGSLTELVRKMEEFVYTKCYGKSKELAFYLRYSKNVEYRGTGLRSGFARCSGAPDTCVMNSVVNYLVAAFATTLIDANDNGFFGGDDGLLFAPFEVGERLMTTARSFGLEMKMEVSVPGRPFTFLARTFQWGCVDSMCVPDRLCPKIGILNDVVIAKYAPARMMMKLQSLLENDGYTPGVGDMIRSRMISLREKHQDLCDVTIPQALLPGAWESERRALGPWPNVTQSWMLDVWSASTFSSKN